MLSLMISDGRAVMKLHRAEAGGFGEHAWLWWLWTGSPHFHDPAVQSSCCLQMQWLSVYPRS